MNKTELVAAIAEKTELSKKDAEGALNAFVDVVSEELKQGEKVQLVGFGTFEVRQRKAREGRNPRNPDEVIKIPASKAPVFKAGKSLKALVTALVNRVVIPSSPFSSGVCTLALSSLRNFKSSVKSALRWSVT